MELLQHPVVCGKTMVKRRITPIGYPAHKKKVILEATYYLHFRDLWTFTVDAKVEWSLLMVVAVGRRVGNFTM